MAFNETQSATLKNSAYTAHNLQEMINKLYTIGLSCEGEADQNSIGHNIYNSLDRMTDMFFLMCGIPSNGAATLLENTKPIDDEDMSNLTSKFIEFISGDIDDTKIIKFANELRDDFAKARKRG